MLNPIITIPTHAGETQPPKVFVLILLFKVHWPYFQCFLLYCYDESFHCYIAIEIFLIVGYITS